MKVTKYTVILTGFNGSEPDGSIPSICYNSRKPILADTKNQAILHMNDMKRYFNAEYSVAEVTYEVNK